MKSASKSRKEQCQPTPAASSVSRTISLPLIDPQTGMKHSRAGRRRFYVLAGVHVLMIAHFVHWLWAGKTLTPIEPSEAKDVFWHGEINLGFIFFSLAILSTLVLGRWVCGWGCHLVAYQDLTLWLLKKLHLRPKAFRTRFLFKFTTLVLAAGWLYFVPLIDRVWSALNGHSGPEITLHLTRTGYWDTFPGPVFAVLSVLFAGIVIIYFLGPKGFCTYACPYGAIFAISDRFAPSRIRVTDACNQCGHCTASCTSNVNVAEEVNLFKMVVDPGCMKCLDCVEVCPNDALYVGLGRPAVGSRPDGQPKAPKYDLTLVEEVVSLALFVLVLVTVNGLYGQFPYLMSLAIAGILTFVFMKTARVFYSPDAMIQKIRLKIGGRLQPAGIAVLASTAVLLVLLGHSAIWRYHDIRAGRSFAAAPAQAFGWPYNPDFVKRAQPSEKAAAQDAALHFETMQHWGLADVAAYRVSLAWCYLFLDRGPDALAQLCVATDAHPDTAAYWLWRARIEVFLGQLESARASFGRAMECERPAREALTRKVPDALHPLSSEIWTEWGQFLLASGETTEGVKALESAISFDPRNGNAPLALLEYHGAIGDLDAARDLVIDCLARHVESPAIYSHLERLRTTEPSSLAIVEAYRNGLRRIPGNVAVMNNLATALTGMGQLEEAVGVCRKALEISPNSAALHATLGAVLLAKNDAAGGIREFEIVHQLLPDSGEHAIKLAFLYARVGRMDDARRLLLAVEKSGTPDERQTARSLLSQIAEMEHSREKMQP
ncbi:MAG: 4Fe-4S binding protein [Phycisphaerae bacterium]|nr:4Fe-4S binding protein [Phycisphaerae bacterium]